jgi:hypothetical protein
MCAHLLILGFAISIPSLPRSNSLVLNQCDSFTQPVRSTDPSKSDDTHSVYSGCLCPRHLEKLHSDLQTHLAASTGFPRLWRRRWNANEVSSVDRRIARRYLDGHRAASSDRNAIPTRQMIRCSGRANGTMNPVWQYCWPGNVRDCRGWASDLVAPRQTQPWMCLGPALVRRN